MTEQDYHSKAGLARAEKLSPDRRSEIASQAAKARWTVKAIKKGNLKEVLGADIDCYVVDDEHKTVIISQTGMAQALGFQRGNDLLKFLNSERIAPYVSGELKGKLEKPLIFQGLPPAANIPPPTIHGYNIEDLIDYCLAVIRAFEDGKLLEIQEKSVRQAKALVVASAKLGIKHLAYAICGYDPIREAVIADFRRYVREDAGDYEKLFPRELYGEWARIYQLPIHKCPNGFELRPWKFKYLTEDHVYWPVAKTKGAIQQYLIERRKQTQGFGKRLLQWLNEDGREAVRNHINRLIGMMDSVEDGNIKEYEKRVENKFGKPPKE